jgi:hypothetical protein
LDDLGGIGAPDLIIEILAPGNNKKELQNKYDLYKAFGVILSTQTSRRPSPIPWWMATIYPLNFLPREILSHPQASPDSNWTWRKCLGSWINLAKCGLGIGS